MRLILFEVKEEPCTKSIHGWNGKPRIDTSRVHSKLKGQNSRTFQGLSST